MRTRQSILVVLLASATAATPPIAHAAGRHGCVPSTAKQTLPTPGPTRLYTALNHVNQYLLYACRPHHKRVRLGFADPNYGDSTSFTDEVDTRQIAVDGPYVAVEANSAYGSGEGSQSYLITVRDIRTGRALTQQPTGDRGSGAIPGRGVGPTTQIVLRNDGAVAWIAIDTTSHTTPNDITAYEIWAGKGPHITRVARIEDGSTPTALSLRSTSVSWTDAGQRVSESFPSTGPHRS